MGEFFTNVTQARGGYHEEDLDVGGAISARGDVRALGLGVGRYEDDEDPDAGRHPRGVGAGDQGKWEVFSREVRLRWGKGEDSSQFVCEDVVPLRAGRQHGPFHGSADRS